MPPRNSIFSACENTFPLKTGVKIPAAFLFLAAVFTFQSVFAAEDASDKSVKIKRLLEYSGLPGTVDELYSKFSSPDPAARKSLLMDAVYSRPYRNLALIRQFALDNDGAIASRAAAALAGFEGRDAELGSILMVRAAALDPMSPDFDSFVSSAVHFGDMFSAKFVSAVKSAAVPEAKLAVLAAAARSGRPDTLALMLELSGEADYRVGDAAYAGVLKMLGNSAATGKQKLSGAEILKIEDLAVKLAGSENSKQRAAAMKTLGAIGGTRAVSAVKDALEKFKDARPLSEAVEAARKLRAPALSLPLANHLANPSAPRAEILEALREIPSKAAWDAVAKLFGVSRGELRAECIYTLASIDGKRALSEILPDEFGVTDSFARLAACSSAAGILRMEPPLRAEHLEKFLAMLSSENSYLRDSAAAVLIELGDQRVVTPLLRNIERGGIVSISSVMPLAAIAGKKSGPYLQTLISSPEPLVSIRAAQALCFLGNASFLAGNYRINMEDGYLPVPTALEELFGMSGLNYYLEDADVKRLSLPRNFITTGASDEPLDNVLARYIAGAGLKCDANYGLVFFGTAAEVDAYRAWQSPERKAGLSAKDIEAIVKIEETRITIIEQAAQVEDALKSAADSAGVELEFADKWYEGMPEDYRTVSGNLLLVRPVDAFRALCSTRGLALEISDGKLIISRDK